MSEPKINEIINILQMMGSSMLDMRNEQSELASRLAKSEARNLQQNPSFVTNEGEQIINNMQYELDAREKVIGELRNENKVLKDKIEDLCDLIKQFQNASINDRTKELESTIKDMRSAMDNIFANCKDHTNFASKKREHQRDCDAQANPALNLLPVDLPPTYPPRQANQAMVKYGKPKATPVERKLGAGHTKDTDNISSNQSSPMATNSVRQLANKWGKNDVVPTPTFSFGQSTKPNISFGQVESKVQDVSDDVSDELGMSTFKLPPPQNYSLPTSVYATNTYATSTTTATSTYATTYTTTGDTYTPYITGATHSEVTPYGIIDTTITTPNYSTSNQLPVPNDEKQIRKDAMRGFLSGRK